MGYIEDYIRDHGLGPNAERIKCGGHKIIRGKLPAEIRKELNLAVKSGHLGHLKKDGLLPEIYFHPDHLHLARDIQKREALDAIRRIQGVVVGKDDCCPLCRYVLQGPGTVPDCMMCKGTGKLTPNG